MAKDFYDSFHSHVVGDIALMAVFDDGFCEDYPGSTISIKSYAYPGKYDNAWGKNNKYTWQPTVDCQNCDIDYTYTCPEPPPPCNVCWKWTLDGCEEEYYYGSKCNDAVNKLRWYLESIGYSGERGGGKAGDVSTVCLVRLWGLAGVVLGGNRGAA